VVSDQRDDQPSTPPLIISRNPRFIPDLIWLPMGAKAAMTNIVNFRTYSSTKARKQSERAAALLATVAHGLIQIGQTELKSKKDLQQALLFIALSNAQLRQFAGHVRDDEGRARMMAQTDRIEELVEDAGRKAAAL
jgi:hypothetical protein